MPSKAKSVKRARRDRRWARNQAYREMVRRTAISVELLTDKPISGNISFTDQHGQQRTVEIPDIEHMTAHMAAEAINRQQNSTVYATVKASGVLSIEVRSVGGNQVGIRSVQSVTITPSKMGMGG